MYSRKIIEPPEKLIKNGKPVFGTFSDVPKKLDIRGVERPFGVLPLPTFITDLRIRSSLFYMFNTKEFIGGIDFFDARLFGHAEVVLWEKNTGRKLAYRAVIGPRRRIVPKKTDTGVCISFSRRRYIRVSWDTSRNCLSTIFDLQGDSARPDVSAAFNVAMDNPAHCAASVVLPAPVMRRCMAKWFRTGPLVGSITLQKHGAHTQPVQYGSEGSVLLEVTRAYYKLRLKVVSAMAAGMIKDKCLSFSISSSNIDAANSDVYNDNFLFYDGQVTPLPPVKITYPFGIKGKWIIQDTENMVDLSFTPVSEHSRTLSIFILRTQGRSIYGTFDGAIQTKDGQLVTIKDFSGMVRKQLMRL